MPARGAPRGDNLLALVKLLRTPYHLTFDHNEKRQIGTDEHYITQLLKDTSTDVLYRRG